MTIRKKCILLLSLLYLFLAGCVSKGMTDHLKALDKKDDAILTRIEQHKPAMGELMNVIQARHARLYFAGQAGNWELAAHQLQGIKETLAKAAALHEQWEDVPKPLTMLAPLITDIEIETIGEAIKASDRTRFMESFERLTKDCNTCHKATKRDFIVIQIPISQGYNNINFSAP